MLEKDRAALDYQTTQFSGSLLRERLQPLLSFQQLMVKVGRKENNNKTKLLPTAEKITLPLLFFPL